VGRVAWPFKGTAGGSGHLTQTENPGKVHARKKGFALRKKEREGGGRKRSWSRSSKKSGEKHGALVATKGCRTSGILKNASTLEARWVIARRNTPKT